MPTSVRLPHAASDVTSAFPRLRYSARVPQLVRRKALLLWDWWMFVRIALRLAGLLRSRQTRHPIGVALPGSPQNPGWAGHHSGASFPTHPTPHRQQCGLRPLLRSHEDTESGRVGHWSWSRLFAQKQALDSPHSPGKSGRFVFPFGFEYSFICIHFSFA
jgi:hypothetical protein